MFQVYTEHGLCYAFNLDGKLNMTRTGAQYGLSLRLHVAQDDYFRTQVNDQSQPGYQPIGDQYF